LLVTTTWFVVVACLRGPATTSSTARCSPERVVLAPSNGSVMSVVAATVVPCGDSLNDGRATIVPKTQMAEVSTTAVPAVPAENVTLCPPNFASNVVEVELWPDRLNRSRAPNVRQRIPPTARRTETRPRMINARLAPSGTFHPPSCAPRFPLRHLTS
jgi:hypothetical protein